jgi:SAM-dependent methyltransferase
MKMMRINGKLISDNLELRDDIWFALRKSKVSYPDEGNEKCFQIEENSFWFRHRNNCILEVVKQFPPAGIFYDVGGGNGFVSAALEKNGIKTVLVEPGKKGVLNARKRGLRNIICASLEESGFKPATLPAVGLFDVIEHIEDDKTFLKRIFDLLVKDGRIYITAPAFSFLWSKEDEDAGHFRRYTVKSLSALLKEIGYHVEYVTYIFSLLPAPVFLFRSLPYRLGLTKKTGMDKVNEYYHPRSTGIAAKLLGKSWNPELGRIRNRKGIPVGGSCLVAASR